MKQHIFDYPSLNALIRAAVDSPSDLKDIDRASRTAHLNQKSWDNGVDFPTAARIGLEGNLDGARKMQKVALETVDSVMRGSPRLDPVYRLDEGQWIDVSRYVRGEPECWGAMVESEPTIRRGVALILNMSISHRIGAAEIMRVGAAVGGAVLALQAQGHAVTVYAAQKIGDHAHETMLTYAPINPGASPLDMSHLATVLEPWFLRRLLFSLEEGTRFNAVRDGFGLSRGGTYGSVETLNAKDEKIIAPEQERVISIDIGKICQHGDDVREYILNKLGGK